ncbi:unnamed protein product [Penicillium crustosum]
MFVDVICIFEDDLGGLNAVQDMILTWAHIGSGSSLPHVVRPRIIVVLGQQSQSVTQDQLDENDFFFDLCAKEPSIHHSFADIRFCRLPSEGLSPSARFLCLGADISRQLHDARFVRLQNQSLFSATHLDELFRLAAENLCVSPLATFDFISASRQHNLLDGSFGSHLMEFLLLAGKSRIPYEGVSSHIASAILMDAFPPGMHFHRTVYSTDELTQIQCDRIESRITALLDNMTQGSRLSAQVHLENLLSQKNYWGWLRSNRTCLICIRRYPEHSLPCGHSLCDTCVQIFGTLSLLREEEYHVSSCPLCGSRKALTVRLKPSTSASRILSIDGGGSRGIIPLENLNILQNILGPELPLTDMIDLTVGCSSGGLIALSKFMLRMDINSCMSLFRELASKVLTQKKRFIRSWLSDGLCDVTTLENALKDHYTPTRKMFDTPQACVSSNKVAVIASEIKDGAPFIFTNYNGSAPHRAEPG